MFKKTCVAVLNAREYGLSLLRRTNKGCIIVLLVNSFSSFKFYKAKLMLLQPSIYLGWHLALWYDNTSG